MYRILCGSQEIFNGENIGELPVVSARQSEQLNESGNLQFTLAQGHPLYGLLEAMASYITSYDDDEIIFEGRVLECPKPGFSGQITYDCEGALSYLMDSEVTPSKNAMTKTVQEFFAWCIAQHNADIENDPRRTFTVGNVTIPDRAKSEKFQITSYTQTKTVIENNLINVYGGYLKIRHENGVRYLDWLEHYSDQVNPQLIVLGENVIEQAFNVNGENLFTVIRPVGKNGLLLDTPTINVFSNEEINNKYGRIVRSVSFSDADTKAKLQTKANEYIARLKATLLCSGSIRLVDMHYLDGTSPKIKMGARFNNIQGLEGITMTVSGMERNYMEPYVDDCSFGNDKSLSDGTPKGGGSISRSASRAGSSAGMNYKHIIELEDTIEINAETLYQHGQTLINHYNRIESQANQISTLSTTSEELVDLVDDQGDRLVTIEGTGVIQNDELLTQFAGTMRLVRDSQGIVTGIQFVDGTMVMDTVDGHMVTVGAAIAAAKNGVESIQGSSLWTMRDNVTGVVGEFDIVEDPTTHVKTVVIKSGGGMKIRQNNVEYGVYQTPAGENSAVLTGGLIVDKINDGTTTTKIKGTRVVLGTDLTGDDLNTWAADARAGTGVFAKYLTVKQLTAQDITTLLANIDEASIDHVVAGQLTAEGSVHGSNVTVANHLYYGVSEEDEFNILDAEVNGDTLTLYRAHGDPITFRKAGRPDFTGSGWNNAGKYIVYNNGTEAMSTELQYLAPTGNITKNNKVVSRKFKVQYGVDEEHLYDTGFESTVAIDASEVFTDGVNSVSVTGAWSGGTYQVKKNTANAINTILQALTPTGNITKNNKVVSRKFKVQYGVDEEHLYDTGFEATVSIDASEVYTDGYNLGKSDGIGSVSVTGAWSGGTYQVKKNNANAINTILQALTPTGSITKSGKVVKRTYKVQYGVDTDHLYDTGFQATVSIDASEVYTDGYNLGKSDGIGSVSVTGAWSGGTYQVKKNNANAINTVLRALTPTGNITKNNKVVSRKFKVQYGVDTDHLYDTGFEATVSIDASDVYDAGYSKGVDDYYGDYIVPVFSERYQDNYNGNQYKTSGGTFIRKIHASANTGIHIPLSEDGANAGSANLTEIPSGGITANGNYKFRSGYAGIRYLSVNVPTSSYSHHVTLTRYRAGMGDEQNLAGRLYRKETNGSYTALGTQQSIWYACNTNLGSSKTVYYN